MDDKVHVVKCVTVETQEIESLCGIVGTANHFTTDAPIVVRDKNGEAFKIGLPSQTVVTIEDKYIGGEYAGKFIAPSIRETTCQVCVVIFDSLLRQRPKGTA